MSNKKFFWVDCRGPKQWSDRKKLLTTALESGADGVLVNSEDLIKARQLGNIKLISNSPESDVTLVGARGEGDATVELPENLSDSKDLFKIKELSKKAKKVCAYIEIRGKKYERLAALMAKNADFVIVVGKDWEVIPLENLIAELQKEKVQLLAGVKSLSQAKTVLETLEVGADGVMLQASKLGVIKEIAKTIESAGEKVDLRTGRVKKLKPVSLGDRVCIDTASLLTVGEGMLIGSQANGLFLVHSETLESEYVASRPFRVNAGAVHAYILTPGGKTKYLSDLKAGDEVLAVDFKGNTRTVVVGRVKIEKRPLMLLEVVSENKIYKTLLQNAETITLLKSDGRPISISKLKEGDELLLHIKNIGRHFGMEIEETLIER